MLYSKRNIILPVVLISSIILAIFSYNYFDQTANQIQELAIADLETNAEIEANSISNSLSNAISDISSNLQIIANSPSTAEGNISDIQTLLNLGLDSTRNLTDGYYFLDSNGRLITFTGIEREENANYKGIDLSHRDYFQIPKQNGTLYVSTVIDSNDDVPRIYISSPIIDGNRTELLETMESENESKMLQSKSNSTEFKGVIVASIAVKTLGNYLEGQIHPEFNGEIAFIDRNRTIIYTQNQTFVGKDYFGNEFQAFLKSVLQKKVVELNQIINRALNSESGLDEFNFENTSTTIAYDAVRGPEINIQSSYDERIGTLFITIPHTLAADVASLIDNQKITNFSILVLIGAIATVISITLLKWNKTLQEVVKQKTYQLRETVDKLRIANENLKLHDKMQKEFINIAAHELRTPTQAISGNLELIEMAYLPSLLEESSEKEQNQFNEEFETLAKDKDTLKNFKSSLVSTYRNSQRLQKLIGNILDISRIESDRLELHKEYFNLNDKIKNVIKDIHNKNIGNKLSNGSQKSIDIVFEPSEDPLIVFADEIRIFQVLNNLVKNAISFSNNNPITISVKKVQKDFIETKQNQNRAANKVSKNNTKETKDEMIVVVSIRDGGTGIDSDIFPKLFTKFATKSNQGTGLGLYISKSIVEAHGGQIWAKNNFDEDKGATFEFSLPLH